MRNEDNEAMMMVIITGDLEEGLSRGNEKWPGKRGT